MANIIRIDPTTFELQNYEPQDDKLISKFQLETDLPAGGLIEFFIYDLNNTILFSNLNYKNYKTNQTSKEETPQIAGSVNNKVTILELNPENDIITQGFNQGKYIAYYNFLNPVIGNQQDLLFISEISSDRTEIRLLSNVLDNFVIVQAAQEFIKFRESQDYFVDFSLNLGDNNLIIANNIKLADEETNSPSILIKLYESLPLNFDLKSELFITRILNNPQAFQVEYPIETALFNDFENIQGPNFNLPLKNQVNNSSQPFSYNDLVLGAPTSSQNQINNLLEETSTPISVDYTKFSEFIHFSSAETRLENFYYKIELIESYSSSIADIINKTNSQKTIEIQQKKISKVIENFDRFEYFMYYNSGSSFSWPKTSDLPPYSLAKTNSSIGLNWLGSSKESNPYYGGRLLSASTYDNSNPDQLLKAIPEYLREDSNNQPYELFIDMVAQYYDNIWLYTKAITEKYNTDNRLDFGISKDLVSDAIKDFGLKLYQNNFSNKELYTAFLGITPNGSIFADPSISSSLPVSTGFEYVNTLISASNDVIPLDDVNKSLYKRIYHNIPYLLKSKGTTAGLRALITSYGIPDTILKISEFGGKDKVNANDYDLYSNNFNYVYNRSNPEDNKRSISTDWLLNSAWGAGNTFLISGSRVPNTIQFRFKVGDTPPTSSTFPSNSSTLWIKPLSPTETHGSIISLEYEGSGSASGSYDGSIKDPNYQYAHLKFYPDGDLFNSSYSASVYLPFYNGDWWSVMVTSGSSNGFELFSGNKIYNGNDGTSIGYYASSSISTAPASTGWGDIDTKSKFGHSSIIQTNTGNKLISSINGAYQEIRYYNTRISESVFKDYIMNPLSIEGNGVNSAPNQLAFRAALGSELDITTTSSIHPKVTGSWATTSSFELHKSHPQNSNIQITDGTVTASYSTNTEIFFLDQPAVGIKNRTTDKLRSENSTLPEGNTLSSIRNLSQIIEASASYTPNINYLEVAFSPQNQINDDIIGQMGHFNIGDYIGNPAQRFTDNNYPDLNNLSEDYFKKYIKQYDLVDFVRLIKFFDNSLFKMIKDFIPTRTSLASGLVIKQHLLERNKYPQPQVSYLNESEISGSITSHKIWNVTSQTTEMSSSKIVSIKGGPGGVLNKFNGLSTSPVGTKGLGPNNRYNITQSFSKTNSGLSGSIIRTISDQGEFYTGEFSGSTLIVSNGELNQAAQEFKEINPVGSTYGIRAYSSNNYSFTNFISSNNLPTEGFIQTWYQSDTAVPLPPPNPTF